MPSAAKHLAYRATAAGHRATRSVRQQGVRRLVRSFGLWPQDDSGKVLPCRAQRSIWPAEPLPPAIEPPGWSGSRASVAPSDPSACDLRMTVGGFCHAERSEAFALAGGPRFLSCRAQRSICPAEPLPPAIEPPGRSGSRAPVAPSDPLACGLRMTVGGFCHTERSEASALPGGPRVLSC